MTATRKPGDLLRFGLTRLVHAFGLAVSVVLLLFLILESGVAGDPALRMAGEHSSPERLADARLQLGFFESWQAEVLHLELSGPPARYYLHFPDPSELEFQDVKRRVLQTYDLESMTIADLQKALAEHGADATTAEGVDAAATGAAGIGHALQGMAIPLQSNRSTALPWAAPRPAWKRFFQQTSRMLQFDFGRSADGQLIADELRSRGMRSLALTAPAFLLGTALAILAALFAGSGRWGRRLASFCVVGMAVSSLAWVLFLRNLFAAQLGWFPVAGWQPPLWKHIALPVLIWVLLYFFPTFLVFRQMFGSSRDHDHYLTARAKGTAGLPLVWNHVARPASAPMISQIVLVLPFLVTGSLLLERIFVIPGLGSYTVDAALTGDAAVLRACTFLIALMYLLCQWLGDWLTAISDPRTRREDSVG